MIRYVSLREGEDGTARIEKLSPDEPDLLLSLREAGDMTVGENRSRIAGTRNPAPVTVRQIHSRRVVWAAAGAGSENPQALNHQALNHPAEADGLLSTDPGTTLGVTVADCMPIYLFGPRVHGILHSGWKGTGISSEALRLIRQELSIEASQMSAVLGPSIRSCCYEVDRERAELFSSMWGDNAVRRVPSGADYIDLLQANTELLMGEGVEDIRVVDACTKCDERFGSFRREGPESFTHMLAMIGYLQ